MNNIENTILKDFENVMFITKGDRCGTFCDIRTTKYFEYQESYEKWHEGYSEIFYDFYEINENQSKILPQHSNKSFFHGKYFDTKKAM